MKALSNMSRLMVSPELLFLLLKVYEAKGKEFYYDELFDRDKDVFLKKTIEQNTYYFGKIIELDLTDARIRLLSRKKLTPKNKKEVLLNNIKGALKAIQKNPKDFEVYPNEFDNLARILSKNYEPIKFGVFEKEQADTILGASKKANKKEVLEQIITEYNRQNKTKLYELTQLIANFYIDFVNAELFTQANEVVAFTGLYAFLIRDFSVFKYVPFFKYFYGSLARYELAMNQANYYYQTGYPNTELLNRLIIDILNQAYDDVDNYSREYAFEQKLNKSDNIEATIRNGKDIFTKEDLRQQHPTVSEITIDRTLKRLKDEGLIQPLGKGRGARWQKIPQENRKGGRQLDIFQFTDDTA